MFMATGQADILEGLTEIISETNGTSVGDVRMDKSLVDDLNVDELTLTEITTAAEERFKAKIPEADLGKVKTVGDLVACIQRNQS